MVQEDRLWQESGRQLLRAGVLMAVVGLSLLVSSCKSLIVTKDRSIPKLMTPLADASFQDLVKQVKPFADLQSLRARVGIVFQDTGLAERWPETDSNLVLMRPDRIRLIINAPIGKIKIAEMVSESSKFKVALYRQSPSFLIGTNDADYSMWREKLGEKANSGLVAARPFHFTEALMMRPLTLNDSRFTYLMEEALIEEPDPTPKAPKNARVLRSFYVVSEIELGVPGMGTGISRVTRRLWFDRTSDLKFVRQQLFDAKGTLTTEVYYSDYKKLSESSADLWPSVILVSRPHDGYSARLLFNEMNFEVNPELPATAFVLENTEKLKEVDLDKPPVP
ncbi:MAG: hypothetical protein JNK38_29300 [Acidobacteria bacterium]|nr:hypothetical protein [Acidobacteriota bacterium]